MSTSATISSKLIFLFAWFLLSGINKTLAQCTNGNQPECMCETAPVLCTVDELDGYVFNMSSFMHPEDGPTPICDSDQGSQTNNPTWFAFTAWCTNLTLRATPSNCNEFQNIVGVQIAIYEDCTFNNEVACDVDIQDCNAAPKVLNMSGLTIGKVYYFMVDGCLGSYCTVTIDVVGVCGEEVIAPWSLPVLGDTTPCLGQPVTYSVEALDGAGVYHWYLDGVLVSQSPARNFNKVWTAVGTYELCIDASNDPCVPVTDDPVPLCVTIHVHDADAGVLTVTPSPLCKNEVANISSFGFQTGPDNAQAILITDQDGNILQVINSQIGSITSDTSVTYLAYAYNYIPSLSGTPVVGMNINDLDCGDQCCDLESMSITFQVLESVVSNIVCDDHGTENDPTDDTYTFDVVVTGGFNPTQWQTTDFSYFGNYGSKYTFGPFPINEGGITYIIQDRHVPVCVTAVIVQPPLPCSFCVQTVDAGPGSTIDCLHETATLQGAISEAGTFSWAGPNSFFSEELNPVVTDSGWYYLSVSFAGQCDFTDSVHVRKDNALPIADAGPDQLIDCHHMVVSLDGSNSSGDHLLFEWLDDAGVVIGSTSGISVNEAGVYSLLMTNTLNGCVDEDEVMVIIDPDILAGMDAEVFPENCIHQQDGFIQVNAISGGLPPFMYVLNDSLNNLSGDFLNLPPGTYSVSVVDAKGCTLDTSLIVHEGLDLQLMLIPMIELIIGHRGDIHASLNVPATEIQSIQWHPPGVMECDTCLTTSILADGDHSFILSVVHENGCTDTASIEIHVVAETEIYIPNIFSPNGDGVNDYFTVYSNERVESIMEFNVYSRWGDHVFHKNNLSPNDDVAGWDGTFRAEDMMPGAFVYTMQLRLADGSTQQVSGDITLIR